MQTKVYQESAILLINKPNSKSSNPIGVDLYVVPI